MIQIQDRTINGVRCPVITVVRGDSGEFKFIPYKDDEEYVMSDKDKLRLVVKEELDGEPVIDVYAQDGVFVISSEASGELKVGKYYYDISMENSSGNVDTYVRIPTTDDIKPIHNFYVAPGV